MAEPANTSKVEPKVKAAALAQFLLGVVGLAIFNAVTDANLLTELPDAIEIFVLPLVPTIGGLIAGYAARHQWRQPETPGGELSGPAV